jgi:hypothetical protein
MRLISGFVDTYLRLTGTEERRLREEIASFASEEERESTMEIVTSWMEEGLQIGRQQGVQQAVLILLRHRFGRLSPKLVERIHGLSTAQSEALLDFGALTDLEAWLEREASAA